MPPAVMPPKVVWPRSAVRSLRWLSRLLRLWQSPNRVFLSTPPGHYYSPLPDTAEVARDAGRIFADPGPTLPGVSLEREAQLALLGELGRFHADLPFGADPKPGLRYHYENTYFPYADGVTLYCLMRHLRPARVIEVGSGFSSAVMLDTDELCLGGRTEFTFIDPYPERVEGLLKSTDRERCRVFAQRVQEVPLELFQTLRAGDWLFIDSSHVSKIGSDVNHLFLEVMPRLAAGVVVHVHDIFWPFEYPPEWLTQGRAWNESYLLRGLLTGGMRYRVLLFTSYLERHAGAEWSAALPTATRRAAVNPHVGSASLYLRVQT
ncbi:MAG: class I SAM-dependent methyltransferase [Gemmataceae bacterium]